MSEIIRDWLIQPILDQIKQTEANIMAALDDKTAAIVAAVTQVGNDLATLVTDLKNNSGAPTPAQLSALDAIVTSLTSIDTTIKADDPGPAPAAPATPAA